MNNDRRRLLARLGVDPESTPRLLHLRAVRTSVAHGLSGVQPLSTFVSRPAPPLGDLSPVFQELPESADLGLELGRHQLDPSVVCAAGVPVESVGDTLLVDGEVWLDGRGQHWGAVLFETSGGRFVVENGPDGLFVFDLSERTEAPTFPGWRPFPETLPELPPLDFVSEGPVRRRVLELASSSSRVERAASVGTAARLHEPSRDEKMAILEGRSQDPTDVAGSWARSLSASERTALERVATERAARLRESLDALQEELSMDEWLTVARERDALASVQTILWCAGDGAGLSSELRCLDLTAVTKASFFPDGDIPAKDSWLAAVARENPEAWWAFGSEPWGS